MKTDSQQYLFDDKIAALKDLLMLRIDGLEDREKVRNENEQRALGIQTTEIHRRLELLNGEAERLRIIQATYLPREVYEANLRRIADDVISLREERAKEQGRQTILASVVSVGVSVLIGLLFFVLNTVF